ncbi:MAG: alkaline phosphatase family protein [Acidobacteriia bacterium]|nr:alkaline phosphatase family protein [Terriglobia bacterium]
MKSLRICALLLLFLVISGTALATAYNAQPKLVVIVIIDQFRADYLERAHDQFGPAGLRLLTERGAYFADCNYDYANTETAPGHATLLTGAYSDRHGILANEMWREKDDRWITAVSDDNVRVVGMPGAAPSASPHNLLSETLGDELKMSTQNRSRVYTVSLKDRAAVLTGGFSADGAFWIEPLSGTWISSSFYMKELPKWAQDFNASGRAAKYWNRDWKDAGGSVLQHTTRESNSQFYYVIGGTGFGNEYELDFARALVTNTNLGEGPATDLLVVSLSPNDILGHRVGPDSPQMQAMWLEMDRQLADFFAFLGQRIGLANVWLVLSSDHGVAPVAEEIRDKDRIDAKRVDVPPLIARLNVAISKRLNRPASEFVHSSDYEFEHLYLSEGAFMASKLKEADAERIVGEELLKLGYSSYFTKTQLQAGQVPPNETGRRMLHSYAPVAGWWVLGLQPPFALPANLGTSHGSPYFYDTHVPLAFFGVPFQAGVYRGHCEPVDMAATLASMLGINAPSKAIGRVLTEALRPREDAR